MVRLGSKLFNKKNIIQGIVGLSISRQGIAVAVTRYTENQTRKLTHCEFIPSNKTNTIQEQLNDCVKRLLLTQYECYLVLSPESYRRVNIEMPPVAENEVAQAIRWKIDELVDVRVDNAVLDYYHTPSLVRMNQSKMLDVIVSPNELIQEQINSCLLAGLRLKVIDIRETVLRNLATRLAANNYGVALLYLSETSGMIVIVKESTIYLARKLDIGYRKLGLNDVLVANSASAALLAQNNLALEIQRSLDYVESYFAIPPINEIAVVPLTAHTDILLHSLSANYGINASIIDLAKLIEQDKLDAELQSLCALVIGVTLRDNNSHQQINLYRDSFQHKPQLSIIRQYLGEIIIISIVAMGFNGYLFWSLHHTDIEIQQAREQLQQETVQLNTLLATLPKQDIDMVLAKEVTRWQQLVQELTQAVQILTEKNAIPARGFSHYFAALANGSIADIWFTALYFDATQTRVQLEGSTFKPQQIAYFLQQLQAEPSFRGQIFTTLTMASTKENTAQIDFILSSTLEPLKREQDKHDR